MNHRPAFPPNELDRRRDNATAAMRKAGLDCLVIGVPENIYYLTGLDHWGYFACHLLLLTQDGESILINRAMERITVENQVRNARYIGYADDEDPADAGVRALRELGATDARVGLEKRSLFLTPHVAEALQAKLPDADWIDASGLLDALRQIKSPLEIEHTRKAAAAADAGTLAAIEAVRDGATDSEVAAACHRALILAGSDYPGFGPFIRPTSRLGEEHTTWRGDTFRAGDAVFLELAGAVRRYHAPMGRLVYLGNPPEGIDRSVELAISGMKAIREAIRPGAAAGDAYAAWRSVARAGGLAGYERHHCGYLVGIGFPPSWTGGSMVTGLAPNSRMELKAGMVFHLHSWFTDTDCADYFISNTAVLTDSGCEILTQETPETLIVR